MSDPTQALDEIEVLVLIAVIIGIAALGWFVHWLHKRMHEHISDARDSVNDNVNGVRVRLERHDEDVRDERMKERGELTKLRLGVFQHIRDWIKFTREGTKPEDREP